MMTNEKNVKGIKIPEVCGRAEKYDLTVIMYQYIFYTGKALWYGLRN